MIGISCTAFSKVARAQDAKLDEDTRKYLDRMDKDRRRRSEEEEYDEGED